MSEKIRMIWDFRGPQAEGTARHHAIHLNEFAQKESIEHFGHGSEVLNEMHSIAYLIIDRKDMIPVRDALKPNRATTA